MFLEKFFLSFRTKSIRKEIFDRRQHSGETLYEYWERFNKLCATCPYHQINKKLLIQYFFEGLMLIDRSMIDATSGGALMYKTPIASRNLISNMTENPTNTCPTLQEIEPNTAEIIAMMGGQQYRQSHDQYINQRYGFMHNIPQNQQRYQPPIPKYQEPPFNKIIESGNQYPLLDAIKQILKYAKFLKELCTHKKKKLKGDVEMGRNVSALIKSEQVSSLIQPAMPKKCRYLGTFTVPCTISECTFVDAMLDLGASINVMLSSVYRSLKFGDLEPTGQAELTRINKKSLSRDEVILASPTSSRSDQSRLGNPCLASPAAQSETGKPKSARGDRSDY
ncbi:hypothetical protein CR513_60888, partial [Mucuna pruriens]